MSEIIPSYLRSIQQAIAGGKSTEHTHRPAIKTLLEALAPGVIAINEPRRVACGAPDFVIEIGPVHNRCILGYMETKDVGINLDEVVRSEQLKRYLAALPNLVLTDYLEFRWFVDGELRLKASLGLPDSRGRLKPETKDIYDVGTLLAAFLAQPPLVVGKAKDLATRMARLAHLIRDAIVNAFEASAATDGLTDLRRAFAQTLIPDLMEPEKTGNFADMFAQTIAYGLFAARCFDKTPETFSRDEARHLIPKTNPFLRRLFDMITGPEMDDEPYAGFVEDLVQLLGRAQMDQVLADFGKRTKREDPIVHFYETFLAAYDPKLRKARGVYYTPEPVVSYIVRSVDYILKTAFGCPDGLADTTGTTYSAKDESRVGTQRSTSRVLILDPACGTGTFLYAVVDHIRDRFMREGNAGMWSGYVKNHLLPRLFGFELLMAPYSVAHFKLGMQLAGHDLPGASRTNWAYDFAGDERLGVYLTNTLEEAAKKSVTLFGPMRAITEEASAAAHVKRQLPIMVVIGNPPYAGHSANASFREVKKINKFGKPVTKKQETFIGGLIKDYFKVDGAPLGEKNPKWLQDDYVKFLRFGQWRIEQTGSGILAFITNHGYLDNPTFRGMRQSLMNTFDDIYILDLHGNSKKKEKAPDGGKDENVFDIQQGVAIALMVKHPAKEAAKRPAKVRHAELWGLREGKEGKGGKYGWLFEQDVQSTQWKELEPQAPFYLFVPQDIGLRAEYEKGWKVTEIFPVNSVGIVTSRDALSIHFTREELMATIREFADLDEETARQRFDLGKDVRDWKVGLAQADIKVHGCDAALAAKILYRPFDVRWTYYTGKSRGFHCMPRPEVMRHMLANGNLALVSARSNKSGAIDHFFCSAFIMETKCGESTTQSCLFPLSLLDFKGSLDSLNINNATKAPNLAQPFLLAFKAMKFTHEQVFNYIYAIFHCPTYRSRYAEFLKGDFPRVPLTKDRDLFKGLCDKGGELVALHLLESPLLSKLITRFPVPGEHRLEKGYPKFVEPGRVHINADQYFEGVPPEVWNFQIGGYQVAHKWLKDRQGRQLSYDDLTHYQKTITALHHTIRLMREIDALIPKWPLE